MDMSGKDFALTIARLVSDLVKTDASTALVQRNVGNLAHHVKNSANGDVNINDARDDVLNHVIVKSATDHVVKPSEPKQTNVVPKVDVTVLELEFTAVDA